MLLGKRAHVVGCVTCLVFFFLLQDSMAPATLESTAASYAAIVRRSRYLDEVR